MSPCTVTMTSLSLSLLSRHAGSSPPVLAPTCPGRLTTIDGRSVKCWWATSHLPCPVHWEGAEADLRTLGYLDWHWADAFFPGDETKAFAYAYLSGPLQPFTYDAAMKKFTSGIVRRRANPKWESWGGVPPLGLP